MSGFKLTRRRLLQAISVSGAAAVLQGCRTLPSIGDSIGNLGGMANRAIAGGDTYKGVNEEVSGIRPWSAEDQLSSDRAKFMLQSSRQGNGIPFIGSELAYPDKIPVAMREWDRVLTGPKSRGYSTLNEHFQMAMIAPPILAQWALQEDGKLPNGEPAKLVNGSILVPPGTRVRARFMGACMDDGMPAPDVGESLTVRPAMDYVHPELRDIYRGVARLRGDDAMTYKEYQFLIWAIRNVRTEETPFIKDLTPRHRDLLNQATPQGYMRLKATHEVVSRNPLNDITNAFSDAVGERLQLNLNGQTLNLADVIQQGSPDQAVDMLLAQVTNRTAAGPAPINDDRGFTTLAEGVAVEAKAADRLNPEIEVVNGSLEPYIFDPAEFVFESPRSTQRVSIPYNPMTPPKSTQDGIAPNDAINPAAQRFIDDLYLFSVDSGLRASQGLNALHDKIISPVGSLWSTALNRDGLGKTVKRVLQSEIARDGVRAGSDFLPIVGNLFSLYELVAGHHILERDNPSSSAERALAAIGVIPGGRAAAGIATRVADSKLLKKLSADMTQRASDLIGQYANSNNLNQLERTEGLRDAAWWAFSDTHQELAGEVDDNLDNDFAKPWRQSIDYVKSF